MRIVVVMIRARITLFSQYRNKWSPRFRRFCNVVVMLVMYMQRETFVGIMSFNDRVAPSRHKNHQNYRRYHTHGAESR